MKAAIYCRVSTGEQDLDKQEIICREYCKRQNIEVYGVYKDEISGMKASRPSFNQMLTDMRKFHFDIVMVTRLDRIGRSLQHLLSLFDEFKTKNVNFIATTQNIDTTTAVGKLQLQVMGAFAEFERNLISERTKEGLQHSKNRHLIGKRGKDKKLRRKRGGLRKDISYE